MHVLAAYPHDPRSGANALIARVPIDLSKNVEVAGIRREGEVYPGLQGLGVWTKGHVRRDTAKSNLKVRQGGRRPFDVLAVAGIHDVCVVRDHGGPVEAHGHAADDDEVNVRSLERLDEYPGLKVGRHRD